MGTVKKMLFACLLISVFAIMLSSCIAELGLLEEVGLDEIAVAAEDAALIEEGGMALNAGRLAVADEAAFTSQLSKIRLSRVAGENPRLFVEGKTRPFGEVLTERGKARLLDYDKEFTINDNVFSVEGDKVNVRESASTYSNIQTTLRKGEMVVKLGEQDGWYQIKVARGSQVYNGFIKAGLIAPVVLASSLRKESHVDPKPNIEKVRSLRNLTINQFNGKLETSLISFEVIGNTINATLKFKNVTNNSWIGIAFKAQGSDGMADYWKFMPMVKGKVRDNLGREYGISEISGLGYGKTQDDWTLIKGEDSVLVNVSYKNSGVNSDADIYSMFLEIWLLFRDNANIQRKSSVLVSMRDLKPI